jgi:CRISPR-associated protein Csh1
MIVPHPIIKTKTNDLELVIKLLKTAFEDEKQTKELKKRSEDRVQKTIAQEKNYFYVDMLFYKEDKKTGAISINLMIEELLPSRFRQLFIDTPAIVNQGKIFKNAITIKKELQSLTFSFQIIRLFFEKTFLEIVHKIFIGNPISKDLIFTNILAIIRKNYNSTKTSDGWVEPLNWTVKKAIMLLNYLQELNIINYNQNYKYMEPEITQKKESRFNLDGFNEFVKENISFLDSDIKVGIFSVGVLTRFLFDIQYQSLKNTPFENKLRGYKLNPELLMQVYTEALDKIQKYQKSFFIYNDLREIINKNFVLKMQDLAKMTNNELSFYFVAGLEMGKQFKKEKQIDNQ